MTTYLVRHAPTAYSVAYRVNGDPSADVPLTREGEVECPQARSALPVNEITTCATSPLPRCRRTAELLLGGATSISCDERLGELDYGVFEGGEFLAYARWLAENGPYACPHGARESQADAISRMLTGLRAVLERPGPRLVVAHGLLVSVLQWAREHPGEPLIDVFLPSAPSLTPMSVADDELRTTATRLLDDLEFRVRIQRDWRVDLGVFPQEVRAALATVSTHAATRTGVSEKPIKEATHA